MRRTPPQLTSYAKANRANMTDEETMLWSELKQLRSSGIRFRRQVPIGNFIVDFACLKAKLIVEVDGEDHTGSVHERDTQRDKWLTSQGYSVMRVSNWEVRSKLRSVTNEIVRALS